MAESVTIAGDLQAAALAQSIDMLGETFTITRTTAGVYSTATSEASAMSTPEGNQMLVKGIWDSRNSPNIGGSGTDVRGREKAIVIGAFNTEGSALLFTPGVGDLVTADSLNDSVRDVRELRGPQGVTTFFRLVLYGA